MNSGNTGSSSRITKALGIAPIEDLILPSTKSNSKMAASTTTTSTTCTGISNSPPETNNNVANVAAQCAANRAARIAKLRTKRGRFIPVKRKLCGCGRKPKYFPNTSAAMRSDELQKWQHHERQLRNRQTATTCHEEKKMYIKELEVKVLVYKMKYEQLQHAIHILEGHRSTWLVNIMLQSAASLCPIRLESTTPIAPNTHTLCTCSDSIHFIFSLCNCCSIIGTRLCQLVQVDVCCGNIWFRPHDWW